jgi:hypothetical protein
VEALQELLERIKTKVSLYDLWLECSENWDEVAVMHTKYDDA